jgi:glucose uptake protein GlcU
VAPWVAIVLDALVLVLFVVVGRRSHHEGAALAGFLRVLWPFAVGLVVSAVVTRSWHDPFASRRALFMCLGVVVIGMALRISVQGRELEPSFVAVTTAFVGALMLGWRAAARRIAATRAPASLRG